MTCSHLITNGTLQCTRADEHDPDARWGHVYDCGDVPDRHYASSGE